MLDQRLLRTEPEAVQANLARRGFVLDTDRLATLEQQRKALQVEVESLRKERNDTSRGIGQAKARGEDIQPLLAAVEGLGDRLKRSENALDALQTEIQNDALQMPNLLHETVPDGADEAANVECRRWGDPAPVSNPTTRSLPKVPRNRMMSSPF